MATVTGYLEPIKLVYTTHYSDGGTSTGFMSVIDSVDELKEVTPAVFDSAPATADFSALPDECRVELPSEGRVFLCINSNYYGISAAKIGVNITPCYYVEVSSTTFILGFYGKNVAGDLGSASSSGDYYQYAYVYKLADGKGLRLAIAGTYSTTPDKNMYMHNWFTAERLSPGEYVAFEGTDEPEEPTATVITYNGETIGTLEAGQTATIKTAETEVEHDIVITPVFPINIAYGDIIATAEAGQTATIKCANTEVEHDIVVSAKADITDLTGTTWLFNSNINRDKSAVGYGIKGTATSGEYTFEVQSIKFGERSGSSNYFTIEYAPVGSSYGAFFRQWGNWEYYDGSKWYNISTPPTLTITGGTDAKNTELIEWLKANATKQ